MRPRELLLTCLGENPGSLLQQSVPSPVWQEVAQEAIRHGLAPLLYQRVQLLPRELAPPPGVVAQLRDLYVHNELRNTSVYMELAHVLRVLHDAGVEVIVLKGACLAETVYGDIALRPMHDVDLLVRTSELSRVQSILQGLGYSLPEKAPAQTRHHLPPLTKPGTVPIEVHWTTVRPSSVSPDLHHLWGAAQEAEVAGVPALTLSPEHLLHHLCLHASYHHRFRVPLLQLHDIAAVARHHRNLNWGVLEEIVRLAASRRFVYSMLEIVQRAFPGSVPSGQLERFEGSSADEALLDTAWECLIGPGPRRLPRLSVQLAECTGTRARFRLLWQHGLLLREQIRSKHGVSQDSLWVYRDYLTHSLSFLRRKGRLTAEILLYRSVRESLCNWAKLERWTETADAESLRLGESPIR